MRKSLVMLAIAAGLAFSTAMTPAFGQARTDVNVGLVLEPPNLDPTAGAAAAIDEVVYANVFEGLTRIDRNGQVQPGLAESWEISEDGLTYAFKLREGVTFHDGAPFSAEDVKFSYDRARAEDSVNAQKQLFADIASVDVVDPNTVRVTLSKPNGDFLYNMGWGDAVIVSPATAENNATNPVGTGPFRFVDWVQGDRIIIERNADYWGEAPKLERATFRFIGDPTAATAAILAGDVDTYPNFPAPEALEQIKTDPRFEVVVGSTEGETIMSMNQANAPLDNIKVRQAIAHAIDRQAIIDGAMFGYGTPIATFFPPTHPDYVDLSELSTYDPERAKQLLEEAGYDTSTVLDMKLPPVEGYARRGGEIIAQQLAAVGIKVNPINVEWAQWLSDVFANKDYDLTIVSHTEPNDINIFSRGDAYYFNYNSDAFNQTMTDISNETDPAKRSELMKQAQTQLANDYPVAFLFQLAKVGVNNANLEGMWENAPTQATDLTEVYWAE